MRLWKFAGGILTAGQGLSKYKVEVAAKMI